MTETCACYSPSYDQHGNYYAYPRCDRVVPEDPKEARAAGWTVLFGEWVCPVCKIAMGLE